MLREEDKIFKNLYGFDDWSLTGAKSRGVWSNTKEIIEKGSDFIVEVECLGACCNAPMVQINDDYYEDLDEDNFKKILTDLKQSKKITKGSQIGRQTSHPQRENNA